MGICTKRHFLLSVCILQLISTVIRQVFDFLGYMWIPILINFFEIIFIIFGFFGAFQYQPKYVISYSVWNILLLAWNLFLVCLYLDIGILNHQESKVLKLDHESASWWQNKGPGCELGYDNLTLPKPIVKNCVLNYVHVEVFQAGFQCLLALLGCITGICLGSTYLEKDDSSISDGPLENPLNESDTDLPLTSSQYYLHKRRLNCPQYAAALADHVHTDYSDSDDDRKIHKFYPNANSNNSLPYGHAPMSRHIVRAKQQRPKTVQYVDRIRPCSQDFTPLYLSFDKIHFKDDQGSSDTFDKARPKSYCNDS